MKINYKIGLTLHNLQDSSITFLLKNLNSKNIKIDFIIYHQNYLKRKILNLINCKKTFAEDILKNTKFYNIKNINSNKSKEVFKKFKPSLVICNSGIIKQSTIKENNKTYFLNIHASKLPEYRGVSNIDWALLDDKDIHATVHRINNGIDEGDILYQSLLYKNKDIKTNPLILNSLDYNLASLYASAIKKFINSEIKFEKQENISQPILRNYSIHPILKDIVNKKYNL